MCVCVHVHTHTHNGILLSHSKEWNNAICSDMDGPGDYHTKWTKSDRKRQISITHMWNLKNNTGEFIYKTETDIENKRMVQTTTLFQLWICLMM